MKNKIIAAGVVVVAILFALSLLVDKFFLYPALIAAMILMHLGMHGMHGKHKESR
ncbi:MAG: hypothetical protein AABX14_01670 [Candidatus Aenigmatarchaeota archaeon]